MMKRRRKLTTKIVLPAILVMAVIQLVLAAVTVVDTHMRMLSDIDAEAEELLSIAEASSQEAFWSYNETSLENLGLSLLQYEAVARVTMLDDTGAVVFAHMKQGDPYTQKHLLPAYTRTVTHEGEAIGTIQLVYTTAIANEKVTHSTHMSLWRSLLVLLGVAVFTLLVTRKVTRSITAIADGVHAYATGDVTARIEVQGNDEVGELAGYINALFDSVTSASARLSANYQEMAHSREALRLSEERLRYAVEGSNEALWDWDLTTGEFFLSPRGVQMLGLPEGRTVTLPLWLAAVLEEDRPALQLFLQRLRLGQQEGGEQLFHARHPNGEMHWIVCRGNYIAGAEGHPVRVSGFCTDITERVLAEQSIDRLAYYDTLTGLSNRTRLMEQLRETLRDHTSAGGALLYMDLDNFKSINDTRGHMVGDRLLVQLAEAMASELSCDLVSRFGGDEFVLLQRESSATDAARLAEQITSLVRRPWLINGDVYSITCSVGITLFPQDGVDADILLMNADHALYQCKDRGRDCYLFFEQNMNELLVRKIDLLAQMRQSLAREEFVLHYQPQFDLNGGEVVGVEALVRWQHPSRGLLPPGEFIALAEESGLILPLGELVLRSACRQSVAWEAAGLTNLTVAVNISARQFNNPHLVEDVLAILGETGMRPELLELEITESTAMENLEATIVNIRRLQQYGITFSLDDFGTGYSSLNYLKNLPINRLKIDKQFVNNARDDNFEAAVIQAVIQIAHNRNLVVVAEGIETEEQQQVLGRFHCDQVQGYLFSRPLPPAQVEECIRGRLPSGGA